MRVINCFNALQCANNISSERESPLMRVVMLSKANDLTIRGFHCILYIIVCILKDISAAFNFEL